MRHEISQEQKEELTKYFKDEIKILKDYAAELPMLAQKVSWDLSRARLYLKKLNGVGLEKWEDPVELKNAHLTCQEINNDIRKALDKLLIIIQVEKKF